MKIVHVINTMDPAAGGPPAVAVRLAAGQVSLGHEVSIVSRDGSDRHEVIRQSIADVPGLDKIDLHLLEPGGKFERLFCSQAKRQLREIGQGADIFHLHGVWEPLVVSSASIANAMGIAYVVLPHGMLDPWSLSQRAMKKKLALALVHRKMINRSLFLQALNADEANLIGPLKLTCATEVIGNGVFLEEIEPLPEAGGFYKRYPQLEGRPYVLFLSRLHYKKGLDYLADAFAKIAGEFSDLQLVVAGPDGGAQEGFEQQIAKAGLSDRVLVTGPIYGEGKYEALVDASCFCLPSRQEGFSIAITEALACRVPVVITGDCHFPEVAEVGAGAVTATDATAVAEGLRRVMGDESLRQNMSVAGRQLIEARFTWPRIAEQLVAAYERRM